VREELEELVSEGWSGELIAGSLERLNHDRGVLQQWARNAEVSSGDPPDRWTAPDGCNVFPEE